MADLLLHGATEQRIDEYLQSPSHALLVTGPSGVGKGAILDLIATKLLRKDATNNPSVLRIVSEKDKKEVGIDAVRQIQRFTTLKSAATGEGINRVVLIENAQKLTNSAQNALLKIIEEPPADTVLLLSAVTSRQLLPTVTSRVQELAVTTPDTHEIKDYLLKSYSNPAEVDRAIQMSGGLPGFCISLLQQSSEHPMIQAAETARKLLSAPKFERLLLIDGLSKQRELAIGTCDMLGQMSSLMLKKGELNNGQLQQWHNVLKYSTEAADKLRAYGQPKLVLSSLSLHL